MTVPTIPPYNPGPVIAAFNLIIILWVLLPIIICCGSALCIYLFVVIPQQRRRAQFQGQGNVVILVPGFVAPGVPGQPGVQVVYQQTHTPMMTYGQPVYAQSIPA